MGKQYKRSFKVYSAWNYQREIEDLNRASEQGWQLVKGGCFHSVFEKNPNVQYRYQLDYRRIDNMGRYIETFREQGWEYVNSVFNGWHYFRKLYDPTQPEQAGPVCPGQSGAVDPYAKSAAAGPVFDLCAGKRRSAARRRDHEKPQRQPKPQG